MHPTFVALDLETTGLNAERDAIIEVAAVRFSSGGVLAEFQSVVRPEVEVPFRVRQLTGLDAEQLNCAPPLEAVLPSLVAFIGRKPVVGHSVQFDLAFLNRHGALLEHAAIDTFELACILVPEASRYGLAALAELLGLRSDGEKHRALPDAHLHRLLFEALVERARRLGPARLAIINRLARGVAWPLAPVFARAAQDPLPPDERAVIPEVSSRRRQAKSGAGSVDAAALERLIGPEGRFAELVPGFEDRPGQRQMLRRCCEAFNDGAQLMVEAGTGTGKSLAYLLPATAWAEACGRPVVVATHTLNLQDQLLHKDFPVVQSLLGLDAYATVLKGRFNYLCRTRLDNVIGRNDLDLSAVRAVAKILAWEGVTQTGDRSELMLQPDEHAAWRLVSADRDACTADHCRHARVGDCWLQRARGRADGAHVVIVNHALLISDVLAENRLLPHYAHLVVDEAHHLEEVATRALGVEVTESRLREAVAELTAGGGVIASAAALVSRSELEDEARRRFVELLATLERSAHRLGPAVAALFAQGAEFAGQAPSEVSTLVRLTATSRASPAWMQLELAWDTVAGQLAGLREDLNRLLQGLVAAEAWLDGADPLVADVSSLLRELTELDAALRRILERPSRQDVHWLSIADGRVTLCAAPLFVGDALAQSLFASLEVAILTSATLRAGDSFDFLRDRLALPDADGDVVPSPFDFATNALLFVPVDMPEPDRAEYQPALDRAICALALAIGGRTLVLYTSHRGLRRSYREVSGQLGRAGILVIGQGIDGGRDKLLAAFRESDVPTVLLGTRSFWEGIDVPGDALSALVIARLPFEVPTDPVFEARSEGFEDPFMEYSLPLAVLRFRQGFGRLIRTTSDRGIVAVLDSRVNRFYGRWFLDALPPCRRYYGAIDMLPDVAARFLSGEVEQPLAVPDGPARADDASEAFA